MLNEIVLGIMGFIIYMMFRNHLIFRLRQRVNKDIYDSKGSMKMWEIYDTVSYHQMMWRIFTSPNKIEKEFRETVGLK